jgi:hypothetical protein
MSAILASKGVTAVDVFVYDTSLDSDGGAWRYRTTGTSWYNEALNTATRGARREFPAVAVIVAETNKVTIYDGDDPALPMWMVFNPGTSTNIVLNTGVTSVFAMNASVTFGQNESNSSRGGAAIVNFISDSAKRHHAGLGVIGNIYIGSIAERNSAKGWYGTTQDIVNQIVNDVAMTVLPDAPIDPATGLPVPTIAAACGIYGQAGGGASIINGPAGVGTVVDVRVEQGAAGGYQCTSVSFGPNNQLLMNATYNSSNTVINVFEVIPSADTVANNAQPTARSYGGTLHPEITDQNSTSSTTSGSETMVGGGFVLGQSGLYSAGLTRVFENPADKNAGLAALTTRDIHTGWRVGDIRLSIMCELNDFGSVVGDYNLIADDPVIAPSNWALADAWTYSNGVYSLTTTEAYQATRRYEVFKPNRAYSVSYDYDVLSGTLSVRAGSGGQFGFASHTTGGSGTFTGDVRPLHNSDGVFFFSSMSSGDERMSISNISVKEKVVDYRSFGKHLNVTGTLTRTPVMDGAELVAYGGFSGNNYLEQPYNSHLDTGTGDFCIMGWVYNPSVYDTFMSRSDGAGNGWYLQRGNGQFWFSSTVGGGISGGTIPSSGWSLITLLQKSGTTYAYVNGVLQGTGANTANMSIPDGVLWVGAKRPDLAGAADTMVGKMSLWRISATAPTLDQIRKIYEDERCLFREGASCGIAGGESRVKAVAYDPITKLLHVAPIASTPSAVRSVFDGLVRVDNTTTPVGTAISAVNGLVVEE